jgi:hypothetical protein
MDLTEQAKRVLLDNNRNGYTVPSPRLYPFQWSWDSGFIAFGLSYFDEEKAFDEIRNMFKGQWSNGMLPHMNFHKVDPTYFPGPELWSSHECRWAPKDLLTSGITQPPVYGFVLSMMAKRFWGVNPSFEQLVRDIYPAILASHRYLYEYRDPYNEGLPYIHHNWESADNSPVWDDSLLRIPLKETRDVSGLRRDLKEADAAQRPTNDNYNRYIYLVDLFRKYKYDDREIFKHCPFLIQDILFTSMLARSNEGLIHLASLLGEEYSFIEDWNRKTTNGLNQKCWSGADQFYYDYDLRSRELIRIKVSGGLMPLFAGVCSTEQAAGLKDTMMRSFKENGYTLCPSCAIDEPAFDPLKYWRGPVWINVNWMLYHGLRRYGFHDEASLVRSESIALIEANGFYEYFDPRPGLPQDQRHLGGNHFSWTAALYLDFVNNE